jgi:hypothetical protein
MSWFEYYLIFCWATAIVVLFRGVYPVLKQWQMPKLTEYLLYFGTFFFAVLLAPIFFLIIIFAPKIYRETLNQTLREKLSD